MGTRNLTIVKSKGKTKVSQYGQWDGYPTGQGQEIADFLKTVDLAKFKRQVNKLGVYTNEDVKKIYIEAGATPDSEWVSMEVSNNVREAHPAINRDEGAHILALIHKGIVTRVRLEDESYAKDSSCEYWYVINLDKETVQMNGGKEYSFAQWKRKGRMKKLADAESEE